MPPRAIYEHSGPAELVLEGENLTPDTLKLYHNGVLYTPLESSDTYAYYLLGENGTNKVMLNGKNFCTVIVKDVVVPEGLPTLIRMLQRPADTQGGASFNEKLVQGLCINYPYTYDQENPFFMLVLGSETLPFAKLEGYEGVNCSLVVHEGSTVYRSRIAATVTDPTRPSYITYQGFIIAVFNYTI